MTVMYGIPNCGSIKKAKDWLNAQGVAFSFHNYKKDGLSAERLQLWLDAVGWEVLLNRKGTTWRRLPEETRAAIDEASAVRLMLDNPSIIKRPVLECEGGPLVGFDAETYARTFGA